MTLTKTSPWKVGFAQAVLLLCYILFLVTTLQTVHGWLGDNFFPNPFLGIAFFLTTFVFSATLCASIMLGYPARLCFEKHYRRATYIVLWSIGWLALFLIVALLLTIAVHAA